MERMGFLSKRIKLVVGLVVLFVLIIIGISVGFIIKDNYYKVTIQNLDEYMGYLSNTDKKKIHNSFGSFLSGKNENQPLPEDAFIRENSFFEKENGEYMTASFIIDIDSLKISYVASFSTPSEGYTSENPVFDCPNLNETKYPDTECVGMYNSTKLLKAEQANPVNSILPIVVDEFDTATGMATRYDIRGFFDASNSDAFQITIVDYSCNNYDKALQTIRDKGFDPDSYTIKYQNECIFDNLPHTGKNSKGDMFKLSYTYTMENKPYFLIDNYGCKDRTSSEEATLQAAKDFLELYNFKLENYEYGVMTFCQSL